MDSSKIVVGLDIGTTKICVLVARKNESGKVEILGSGRADSNGVQRGVVTNIAQTTESIIEAVKKAEEDVRKNLKTDAQSAQIKIAEVFVGIAGQHIKSSQSHCIRLRSNTDDEIDVTDIRALVMDMKRVPLEPGHEIIDVIPQSYYVDNELAIGTPVGMSGTRLEGNFHIITGQVTAASNIRRCVTKAGLHTRSLFLEPIASSAACLSHDELDGGVCLVDIGGGTTDIAIFHENIIRHTAIIPIAGKVLTNDIKNGCMILERQAEMLKTKFGSCLSSQERDNDFISIEGLKGRENREISIKNLAMIIEARMSEIIGHVYHEIKAVGLEKSLIGGIVLTGGGANIKHLAQFVRFHTGMHARIGLPNEHLAKSYVDVANPTFSTGVGLVLKGFEEYESEEMLSPNANTVEKQNTVPVEDVAETETVKEKKKTPLFSGFGTILSKFLKDGDDFEDYTK